MVLKQDVVQYKGPSSDVTVAGGAMGNIDLKLQPSKLNNVLKVLGVKSISGLPDNVLLAGFSFPDNSTLRLRVKNTASGDVTVSANSVTAEVLVEGI